MNWTTYDSAIVLLLALLAAIWWELRRIADAFMFLARDKEEVISEELGETKVRDALYMQRVEQQDAEDAERAFRKHGGVGASGDGLD